MTERAPPVSPDATEPPRPGPAERRVLDFVKSATDRIVITDGEGRIVYANPSMARARDETPAALVGRSIAECFAIGRRNVVALKKVLWQCGMLIRTHDVGGPVTRTLSLCIEDGRVEVDTPTTSRALGGDLPWF
jgi:PAS domain-containing protein